MAFSRFSKVKLNGFPLFKRIERLDGRGLWPSIRGIGQRNAVGIEPHGPPRWPVGFRPDSCEVCWGCKGLAHKFKRHEPFLARVNLSAHTCDSPTDFEVVGQPAEVVVGDDVLA